MRRTRIVISALAFVVAAGTLGALYRPAAGAGRDDEGKPKAKGDEAAVRETAAAFAKAFAGGDAKAVAAFWTKDGEYVGPEGEPLRGRAAIEKEYAEFFKEHPKAAVEVKIESVRLLGSHTALEEGTLTVNLADGKRPSVSRYSVLHVRDGDEWKMASVREWVPDPAQLVTLKDVEWLVGEWSAKTKEGEASITYAREEGRPFLRGVYSVKREGKGVSSGTQTIGKDPAGGLRSWQFDDSGATGEWAWTRDENGWVIEAAGTLPDGSEVSAVNLLVPVGKDAFTWQSVSRSVAGSELPDTPPVKATRVTGRK